MNTKGAISISVLLLFLATISIALIITSALIVRGNRLGVDATNQVQKQNVDKQLTVIQVSGEDGSNGYLNNFTLTARSAPGSKGITLETLVVIVETEDNSTALAYAGTGSTSPLDANATHYAMNTIQPAEQHLDGVIQNGELVDFYIHLDHNIDEQKIVTFRFIPKEGSESLKMIATPEIMNAKRIQLYPTI